MPQWVLPGVVAPVLVVVVIALVFGVVVPALVRAGWGKWHDAYPPVAPADDAVRRNYQSFSVGLVNLGLGVHVAADRHHLHLTPSLVGRLFGMRPVSIPWEHIEVRGTFPFRKRVARIAGVGVVGPAWCIGLAEKRP